MKNVKKRKTVLLLIAVALILTVGVGTTVAYLIADTQPVVNTFEPTKLPPYVDEYLEGDTKKNVAIQNNGNIPAYIRAKVIITWQDEAGNVYPELPTTADYTVDWGLTDWVVGSDEFYYYTKVVAAGGTTSNLIDSITPVASETPAGYNLHVEVIAQSIQAEGQLSDGTWAVEDAWGVTVDENETPDVMDNTISK